MQNQSFCILNSGFCTPAFYSGDCLYQQRILFRKNGAQIQQDTAFFDSGNNRRVEGTQPCGDFICAQGFVADGQQARRQNSRRRGPAADHGFAVDYFDTQCS